MVDCFVVSKPTDDIGAIYEFSNGYVSLVNNRHFREAASSVLEARKVVEDHAPKFFSGSFSKIEHAELELGIFHPSIARPIYPSRRQGLENLDVVSETATIARIRRDISLLSHDLEECFDVSSPYVENFESFGVTYESIILFACIGIENLFVKVLRDNHETSTRLNTTHFVKLNTLMRLGEYEVVLARYPWISEFSPFKEWNSSEPTKSLKWFNAYNKLKHDKMKNHNQATMRNAINACLGYWIVFRAVFGNAVDGGAFQSGDDGFRVKSFPRWSLQDYYIEPADKLWRAAPASL